MSTTIADIPQTLSAFGRRFFSAPIPGDSTLYRFSRRCRSSEANHRRLPLNTPDEPDYPTHYLVEETDPVHLGGGIVEWTRVYSQIPRSRREGESYSWTLPGLGVEALYAQRAIDDSQSTNTTGGLTRIVTLTNHDLKVGDIVQIACTIAAGDSQQTITVYRTVRGILSPTSLTVDTVVAGTDPFYLVLQKVEGGRDPVTKVVHSILQYDYFLPTIPGQPKRFEDIPIFQPTVIIDGVGKETETYSVSTKPTKASYLLDVAAGKLIVAESSIVRRWAGNIFERTTRFVKAQ